jgi:hypothetical protein
MSDSEFKERVMKFVKARHCVKTATFDGETISIETKAMNNGLTKSCAAGLAKVQPFLEIKSAEGNKITAVFPRSSIREMFARVIMDTECVESAELIEDGYIVKIKSGVDTNASRCLEEFKRAMDFAKLPDGTYKIGPKSYGPACRDMERNIEVKTYTDLRTATDRSSLVQLASGAEIKLAPNAPPVALEHCEDGLDENLNLRCSSRESGIGFTMVSKEFMRLEVILNQGDQTTTLKCQSMLLNVFGLK